MMVHDAQCYGTVSENKLANAFIEHAPIHSNSQKPGELQHFPQLPVY